MSYLVGMETRREYEILMEHNRWADEVPVLNFDKEWDVKIIPPFGGAVIRFRVLHNSKKISVYLDCYDNLGFVRQPYWEAYPINNEPERFYMHETGELMNAIRKELTC